MSHMPASGKRTKLIRLRYLSLILPVVLISLSGCTKNQVAVTVGPGETFTIGVGQSAMITGEDMVIAFNEVIGDSRAPQNVNAIWEGVANSRITITYQGVGYSIVLRQPGRTEQAKEMFVNYTLTHGLNPYPIAGKEISPKEYRLTMTVAK